MALFPAVVLFALSTSFQDPPPPPPPPTTVPTASVPATPPGTPMIVGPDGTRRPAPAIVAPNLPVDARRLVDQTVQQLIEQLIVLQDMYLANKRPDDSAALRAQIRLLRQVAGLPDDGSPRPDVVNLSMYRDRVGQTFMFTITGSADKPVWGTGIYTDDTSIESAAVHAGVLRSGQTGPVRVTILGGQTQYVGTLRNGIESSSFGSAGGSYRIETGPGSASRPTSLANFRGRFGETLILPVVGVATGTVWGSDTYTDDSSLGAAAVHAGVLQPGEFAFVKVTMVGGLSQYTGTTRNGIKSEPYGEWQGSIKIARAPQPWVLKVPEDVVDATGMITLSTLRKHPGVSFSLVVVGATGPVRGSDVYTDDSSIAAAAVHAGLLRQGEKGHVLITVVPGQSTYTGSTQNGIKSSDAAEWLGSFRIGPGSGG